MREDISSWMKKNIYNIFPRIGKQRFPDHIFPVPQYSLTQYYCAKTSGIENTLEKLKKTFKGIAATIPHTGNPVPKVWVATRNKIETLKQTG